MTTFNKDGFRDINPDIYKTHPLQVIRAASISAALVERFRDSGDRPGARREVHYVDRLGSGYQTRMTLQLIQVPQQLTTLTSSTLTTTSGSPEGRLMHSDGSFGAVSAESHNALLGWCFDSYYLFQQNRLEDDDPITQLEAGDWIWVIIKADAYEVNAGEDVAGNNVAAGDRLVTDVDTTDSEGGRVRLAASIGDTSVGDESGNIEENAWDVVVGLALEASTAENDKFFAKVDIERACSQTYATTV